MGRLLVYTRPVSADTEAEYNRWYDEVHLADVCSVPAITGAQRFKVSGTQMAMMGAPDFEYLAIYDFTGPAQAVLDGLAAGGAQWEISDAMDSASARVVVVDELGDRFVP
ncbi:MAG: hypothetical protein OES57_15070 [Acidimicrobiia bacterium]|nr:hypothetical protein [Acidimicrobiia bacterium]